MVEHDMQKIYDHIDDHADEYVEGLLHLCRQPSIAAQDVGMADTAKMVENRLLGIGAKTSCISTAGFPVIYGEIDGAGERTLLFYNHYDVQPPDPVDEWRFEPFSAVIDSGRIWARGVADNKGNLMARICAVDAWQQVSGGLPLTVKFVCEGEEEIGSPNLGAFAEANHELFQADGCIWESGYKDLQGRLQVSMGCKGIVYVELRAYGANTDLHSSNAAIVPNPVWRLVWALNSLKGPDERVLIDGFYDNVAMPTQRDKELLAELDFRDEEFRQSLGIDSFLREATGTQVKEDLIFQPTCNIAGIYAGYTGEGSKTVLPMYAFCKIDFRLVPHQNSADVLLLLRKHLDAHGFADIEVVDLNGEDPARTDPDHPLVGAVKRAATKVYGESPQMLPLMAATGPMYELCQRWGIGAVGSGVGNADSRNHAPNENIYIEDYLAGIKQIATVIDEFART
jgi:acetylornithine deacetylase/succinyl-diaminopimelate desuccinylase-like protein